MRSLPLEKRPGQIPIRSVAWARDHFYGSRGKAGKYPHYQYLHHVQHEYLFSHRKVGNERGNMGAFLCLR